MGSVAPSVVFQVTMTQPQLPEEQVAQMAGLSLTPFQSAEECAVGCSPSKSVAGSIPWAGSSVQVCSIRLAFCFRPPMKYRF
jgi:hypothetical protein